MSRPIYRALGIATPISLLLWVAIALFALQVIEGYRPGFKWHLKMKVYAAAGFVS